MIIFGSRRGCIDRPVAHERGWYFCQELQKEIHAEMHDMHFVRYHAKRAHRVRLSAFRHQSESHSLSAMPCSCSRNEPTANRHRKGTYAVPLHSSPCGHQNGADKTITSVLFQKTHSSAPEQRENLSLQISPTPSFGRDPDETVPAVSTSVTENGLAKLLLFLFDFVTAVTLTES